MTVSSLENGEKESNVELEQAYERPQENIAVNWKDVQESEDEIT